MAHKPKKQAEKELPKARPIRLWVPPVNGRRLKAAIDRDLADAAIIETSTEGKGDEEGYED